MSLPCLEGFKRSSGRKFNPLEAMRYLCVLAPANFPVCLPPTAGALTPSSHADQGSRSHVRLRSPLPWDALPSFAPCLPKHTYARTHTCAHTPISAHLLRAIALGYHHSLPSFPPRVAPPNSSVPSSRKQENSSHDELDANLSCKIAWHRVRFRNRCVSCSRAEQAAFLV